MKNKKQIFYISAFTLLGIILQFLVHSLIEIWYINLLLSDFSRYGLGLSWNNWYAIHYVLTIVLFILGFGLGLWQGRIWWKKIYNHEKSD